MLDDVIKLLFEVERRDVLTVHKTTLDRHVTRGSDLELVVWPKFGPFCPFIQSGFVSLQKVDFSLTAVK